MYKYKLGGPTAYTLLRRCHLPPALLHPAPAPDVAISARPSSIRLNLQQRIRELETALLDERRARENAEMMVAKLEVRLQQYIGEVEPAGL